MRKLILCLAACGATAVCLTHPAGAQEKFNPTVCNQSGEDAQFAVIVRTSAQTWRVRGWYQADDRKCAQLPPFLDPRFMCGPPPRARLRKVTRTTGMRSGNAFSDRRLTMMLPKRRTAVTNKRRFSSESQGASP